MSLAPRAQMETSPYSVTCNPLDQPDTFALSPKAKEFVPAQMEAKVARLHPVMKADAQAFVAALKTGDERVMEMIQDLSLSALTSAMKEYFGVSPLHVLAARGHRHLMAMLLMAGADPNEEELRSGVSVRT